MTTSRIRTIPQAVAEIRQIDENSALTIHGLRQLIASGQFPCVQVGNKRLVSMEKLIAYLNCDYSPPALQQEKQIGTIRKIAVGGGIR